MYIFTPQQLRTRISSSSLADRSSITRLRVEEICRDRHVITSVINERIRFVPPLPCIYDIIEYYRGGRSRQRSLFEEEPNYILRLREILVPERFHAQMRSFRSRSRPEAKRHCQNLRTQFVKTITNSTARSPLMIILSFNLNNDI